MSFDELRKSWQTEMTRPAAAAALEELLHGVERRYGRLERVIHWRDVREILVAMLVVVAFAAGWPLFRISAASSWGSAIVIVSAALIVYVLLSARKPDPLPFNASVLTFSRLRLAWLDRQIRLLQTVIWWYVAPLLVGVTLIAWGLTPESRLLFGLDTLLNIGVGIFIVSLNRRAVRTELMPVRQEVAELIASLESEG